MNVKQTINILTFIFITATAVGQTDNLLTGEYTFVEQDINGVYSTSGVVRITIENKKMVVIKSVYEFYGQPNTIYTYTYKISWLNEKQIKFKLKKSRITGGQKKMAGVRLWANERNPGYDGTYEVKIIDEGIELTNVENSEKIILKRNK